MLLAIRYLHFWPKKKSHRNYIHWILSRSLRFSFGVTVRKDRSKATSRGRSNSGGRGRGSRSNSGGKGGGGGRGGGGGGGGGRGGGGGGGGGGGRGGGGDGGGGGGGGRCDKSGGQTAMMEVTALHLAIIARQSRVVRVLLKKATGYTYKALTDTS